MLLLVPENVDTTVRCKIEKHSLVSPPRYVALSYCWGDENVRKNIVVNNITVSVTLGLEQALRQIRQMNNGQLVWANAICINQQDEHEKSSQVLQMKQIYGKATATYCWLGPHDGAKPDSPFGVIRRLLHTISDPVSVPHELGRGELDSRDERSKPSPALADVESLACAALYDIFHCSYWQRRWIIQEVTVAVNVLLLLGEEILRFDQLLTAWSRCSNSKEWLSEHRLASQWFSEIVAARKAYHDGHSPRLCDAIHRTRNHVSKDPRDKIYAIIGICSDGHDLVPLPSYHQSPAALSIGLTRELIRRHRSFDIILTDTRKRSETSPLPTWTPDWLSPSMGQSAQALAERRPHLRFPDATAFALQGDSSILSMQGVTLGTIVAVTCPLGWSSTRESESGSTCPCHHTQTKLVDTASPRYYANTSDAVVALLNSLPPVWAPESLWSVPHILKQSHLRSFQKSHRTIRSLTRSGPEKESAESAQYRSWLKAHQNFMVENKTLDQLLGSWSLIFQSRAFLVTLAVWILTSGFGLPLLICSLAPLRDSVQCRRVTSTPWVAIFGLLVGFSLLTIIYNLTESGKKWMTILLPKTTFQYTKQHLKAALQRSYRLVLTDTGMIAMACTDAAPGDKICLLLGCTRTVLLREQAPQENEDRQRFSFLGGCYSRMNQTDGEMHELFAGHFMAHYWDFHRMGDQRDALIEKLKKSGAWQVYDLI